MLGIIPCNTACDQIYWFYSREVPAPENEHDRNGWAAFSEKETASFTDNTLRVIQDARAPWASALRDIVSSTDSVKFYPIYRMPDVHTWSSKRWLLVGDAAHAMQPDVGQGVSMALEDVFLLSKLLERKDDSLSKVLQRYEHIRRPRVDALAKAASDGGEVRMDMRPLQLHVKEWVILVGFWLYNVLGLQRWGTGMDRKTLLYNVTNEM